MTERLLVAVVDDDESVREALPDLIWDFGFAARTFASAEDFLASDCIDDARCLVVDVAMPGMSGPELHQELQRLGHAIPTVFITAHGGEETQRRLLARGAVACLSKPFSDTILLAAIKSALGQDD